LDDGGEWYEDAKDFAREAVDTWMEGGEVDFEVWENLIIGPDDPIANIDEYLNCFELNQGAQLTIYIDQPITNDPAAWTTGNGKAGHTFISLSQNGIRRTWGLYPAGNASPFDTTDPYRFGNNQNSEYDVSISLTIDKYALQNIIQDAANYDINYNLDSNNCTDYALQMAALTGLILPDPQSTWPGGGEGSNPGAFGQAIRNMALPGGVTRNNNGGISPANMGDCN